MTPFHLITDRTRPSDAELRQRLAGVVSSELPKPSTGRVQQHKPGEMNKTEARFAELLELRKRAGEIEAWYFEPLKLRLAKGCFYTPDFLVIEATGRITFYEVKGYWRDDAKVKYKTAAEKFKCFTFHSAMWDSKQQTFRIV